MKSAGQKVYVQTLAQYGSERSNTMRLIDLLSTGKQIKTIPKSEIPDLIGEIESLKAQLWMRLMEQEDLRPVASTQISKKSALDQVGGWIRKFMSG
jgi:hypothetical protein